MRTVQMVNAIRLTLRGQGRPSIDRGAAVAGTTFLTLLALAMQAWAATSFGVAHPAVLGAALLAATSLLLISRLLVLDRPTWQPFAHGLRLSALVVAALAGPGVAGPVALVASIPEMVVRPPSHRIRHLAANVVFAQLAAFGLSLITAADSWTYVHALATVAVAGVGISLATRAIVGRLLTGRPVAVRPRHEAVMLLTTIAAALLVGSAATSRDWAALVATVGTLTCVATAFILAQPDRARPADVESLLALLRRRHPDSAAHSLRVYNLVEAMLERLDFVPATERVTIRTAALLHDIGKVTTPDHVLLKEERLSTQEFSLIRCHAEAGAQILQQAGFDHACVAMVRHHHERWDGAGYPVGIFGPAIPLGARVIALADAWDAMTFDRLYRLGMAPARALAEIRAQAGRQFDPEMVEVLSAVVLAAPGPAVSDRLAG